MHEREIERLQTLGIGSYSLDRKQVRSAYDTPEKRMVRDQEDLNNIMATSAAREEELKAAKAQVR